MRSAATHFLALLATLASAAPTARAQTPITATAARAATPTANLEYAQRTAARKLAEILKPAFDEIEIRRHDFTDSPGKTLDPVLKLPGLESEQHSMGSLMLLTGKSYRDSLLELLGRAPAYRFGFDDLRIIVWVYTEPLPGPRILGPGWVAFRVFEKSVASAHHVQNADGTEDDIVHAYHWDYLEVHVKALSGVTRP